jgi:hypothetical protein
MFGLHPREVSAQNLKALSALTTVPASPLPSEVKESRDERTGRQAECETKCGFVRDYYELALEDGGVYRVFRDLSSQKWFLDGAYD